MKHSVTTYNTKKMIAESLKKFLKQKPLCKITVSDLVRDCKINRKTFYYHFQDIYDLLQWMLEEEAVHAVQNWNLLSDYVRAIHFIIDYIDQNRYLLNCTEDSSGREMLKDFFYRKLYDVIFSVVTQAEAEANAHIDDDFKVHATQFYTIGLAGLLLEWMIKGTRESKEKFTHNMEILIDHALHDMLQHLK